MAENSGRGGKENGRLVVLAQGGRSDEYQKYGQRFSAGVEEGTVGRGRDDP